MKENLQKTWANLLHTALHEFTRYSTQTTLSPFFHGFIDQFKNWTKLECFPVKLHLAPKTCKINPDYKAIHMWNELIISDAPWGTQETPFWLSKNTTQRECEEGGGNNNITDPQNKPPKPGIVPQPRQPGCTWHVNVTCGYYFACLHPPKQTRTYPAPCHCHPSQNPYWLFHQSVDVDALRSCYQITSRVFEWVEKPLRENQVGVSSACVGTGDDVWSDLLASELSFKERT